jgi:hypothetical protein
VKPFEETWLEIPGQGDGWGDIYVEEKNPDPEWGDDQYGERVAEVNGEGRRKLAAQAPAMARLLLRVADDSEMEWPTSDEVNAILRAAGVIE